MRKLSKSLYLSIPIMLSMNSPTVAGPISSIVTATADLIFGAPATASAKITPVQNLIAGRFNNAQVLGSATFTSTAGDVAYRWTPGTGTIHLTESGVQNTIEVTGKAGNKLLITSTDSGASRTTWDATASWFIPVVANTSNLSVNIVKSGTGPVAADSYPVSMDAVVWQR